MRQTRTPRPLLPSFPAHVREHGRGDGGDAARAKDASAESVSASHARDGRRARSQRTLEPLSTPSRDGASVTCNKPKETHGVPAARADRSGSRWPLASAGRRRSNARVLALLLLHANEVVSRDRLIDELWADREPGTAGHSLDVQVSRLRKAFEPDEPLVTRAGGYVLEVEPDADRRRTASSGCSRRGGGPTPQASRPTRSQHSRTRSALWRGDALADLAYEAFARAEIERLEELRLVAVEERIDAELALGRHDALVPELEALTASTRCASGCAGSSCSRSTGRGGRPRRCACTRDTRRRLVDELGIEPGQRLRELEQAILRQDPALDLPRAAVGDETAARARRRRARSCSPVPPSPPVVGLTQGGTESAQALAEPDSNVFLSADDRRARARVARARHGPRRLRQGDALWSVSSRGDADTARSRDGQGGRDARPRNQARRARSRRGLGLGDGQELADPVPHRPVGERGRRTHSSSR